MLLRSADWLFYQLPGLDPDSRFHAALHFFFYDTVKIFFLLAVMVFAIGVIRTWLPEQKLKRWMSFGGILGNAITALFGAILGRMKLERFLETDILSFAQEESAAVIHTLSSPLRSGFDEAVSVIRQI